MVSIRAEQTNGNGMRVSAEWVSLVVALFMIFVGGVVAFTKVQGVATENKADISRLDQSVNSRLIRIEDKLDALVLRQTP